MKKLFKDWNWFEITLLLLSLIGLSLCFAFTKDRLWLSYIASMIGVISVLAVAKGLVSAPIICIIYSVIYSIISIMQHYYGEAIIYLGLMIPIDVASIVSWFKNRNNENSSTIKINKIHGLEYLYLLIGSIITTVAFYFLLKALNTSELIISTISLKTSVVASYLMLRRCSYYALGFMANDIVLIVLWSMLVVNSGLQFLPSAISFCIFFINDLYGFIHWKIEEKKQNNTNKENKTDEKYIEENTANSENVVLENSNKENISD